MTKSLQRGRQECVRREGEGETSRALGRKMRVGGSLCPQGPFLVPKISIFLFFSSSLANTNKSLSFTRQMRLRSALKKSPGQPLSTLNWMVKKKKKKKRLREFLVTQWLKTWYVTAVAQVWFLAPELPHTEGAPTKKDYDYFFLCENFLLKIYTDFFVLFWLLLFRAAPTAYGGSQARSYSCQPTPESQQRQIRAVSATYTTAQAMLDP